MQARKLKKNIVVLYPRQTVSELLGSDEAARLNASQPTDSSKTNVSEDAYSIIGKVLTELTTMVRSMDGMDNNSNIPMYETEFLRDGNDFEADDDDRTLNHCPLYP
ncbi:hypothetical protein ACET3Z_005279 [Daucus carota]